MTRVALRDAWQTEASLTPWLGPDAKSVFRLLEEHRDALESEIGYPSAWEVLPQRRDARIAVYLDEADPKDEADRPRQHRWLVERLDELHSVFAERIAALHASDWTDGDEEDGDDAPRE